MAAVSERPQGANPSDPTITPSRTCLTPSQHAFTIANNFLAAYRFCFSRQDYSLASFLLHQAAERFYAAMLLRVRASAPRTHNLEELGDQAAHLHRDLHAMLPRTEPEDRRLLSLLKSAYIKARYSRRYRITPEDLSVLGARVDGLGVLAKQVCEEGRGEPSSHAG